MNSEVTAALIGALTGAIAGGLVTLWLNSIQDWLRIRRTSKKIRLEPEARAGSRITARVVNNSSYAVHGAVAYISIDYSYDDVLTPPLHFTAYVSKKHMRIRIVSADTNAGKWCRFKLEIDPADTQRPVKLSD